MSASRLCRERNGNYPVRPTPLEARSPFRSVRGVVLFAHGSGSGRLSPAN